MGKLDRRRLANIGAPEDLTAKILAGAGILYMIGGMGLTMAVNVPMNEALALIEVPQDTDAAKAIWVEYSGRWQVFNIIRTVVSGAVLAMTGWALLKL